MHTCPHCGAASLRGLAVRWSCREWPARCPACGRLSHVLASTASGIFGTCLVLLSLGVAAAMALESYLVGVAGVAIVCAYNAWAWRSVELFPISDEAAARAAQVSWWFLSVAAFLKIFSS